MLCFFKFIGFCNGFCDCIGVFFCVGFWLDVLVDCVGFIVGFLRGYFFLVYVLLLFGGLLVVLVFVVFCGLIFGFCFCVDL